MTEQQKKMKIERLKFLRDAYQKMMLGSKPKEKEALRCEAAILAKRLEVVQRER